MLSKFKKLPGSAGGYSEQGGKCSGSSWPGPVKIEGQSFLHQEIQPVRNCSRKFYFRKKKKKSLLQKWPSKEVHFRGLQANFKVSIDFRPQD